MKGGESIYSACYIDIEFECKNNEIAQQPHNLSDSKSRLRNSTERRCPVDKITLLE